MNARELKFANALNTIPGVGCVTLRALKNHFPTLEEAWYAPDRAWEEIGLTPQAKQALLTGRTSLHPDREMERLVRENIWLITQEDVAYPILLKEIPNPPFLLYGRGKPEILQHISQNPETDAKKYQFTIGVVGTRKPTNYGLQTTETIVQELTTAGITIVSGLALGIDTQAHQTALEARGTTIAVLGSGLDPLSIFPSENRSLAERITKSAGLVLSEYAPGTPAVKEHFPQRNRIISGISRGVLVVEARERSGALITARFALEQNREVFAVPGSIFANPSQGTNQLIQQGAKLTTSARDIFQEFGIEDSQEQKRHAQENLAERERLILSILEEPLGVGEIKKRTQLETGSVISSLSMLELKDLIRNLGNDVYQKIS